MEKTIGVLDVLEGRVIISPFPEWVVDEMILFMERQKAAAVARAEMELKKKQTS